MTHLSLNTLKEIDCKYCGESCQTSRLDAHEGKCTRNPKRHRSPPYIPHIEDTPSQSPSSEDNNNDNNDTPSGSEEVVDSEKDPEVVPVKLHRKCIKWIKDNKKHSIGLAVTVLIVIIFIAVAVGVTLTKKNYHTTTIELFTSETTIKPTTTTNNELTLTTMRTTISHSISVNLSCLTWDKSGLTIAGAQNGENGQTLNRLYNPRDLIVDNGIIYVSDTLNRRLLKFVVPSTEGQPLVTNEIIHGLSLNQEEQAIYFSQESGNNDLIKRINKSGGELSIIVPGGYVSRPSSIVAFDEDIYICDTNHHRVILWSNNDKNFTIVAGGNGMGSDSNQLQAPQGIFVDVNRNVYVADTFNHRIQLWKTDASDGITVAGNSNLGSSLYQLSSPKAIFVDNGAIFIADSGNNRTLKWNIGESRAEAVIAGGVSNINTNQLYNPTSVKFDSQGNMYVVDNGNNRVQKYLVNNTQC